MQNDPSAAKIETPVKSRSQTPAQLQEEESEEAAAEKEQE